MIEAIGAWLREFFPFFAAAFPRWFGAWLLSLLFLIFAFRALKPRLRPQVLAFDTKMNALARSLRYKLQQVDAALEPDTPPSERVLLTWFFRFWTNFASAPSLGLLAFVVPIWMFYQALTYPSLLYFSTPLLFTEHWLLPTFCYYGSMGLSYVLKRVFKRLRPVREAGAFGHRLKDGSFPSGHSLTAFCFWLPMIAPVYYSYSLATAIAFAVIAVLIVALTGLSRIYMAVHWPSDVAGGFVIGAVWSVVFFLICAGVFLR